MRFAQYDRVMFSTRHRFATWLACFAIVLNTLAPTVSRTLTAWQDEPRLWAQIAEAPGFNWGHEGGRHAPANAPQDTHSGHGNHCPFCLVHAGSFGLAASTVVAYVAAIHSDTVPSAAVYRVPSLDRSSPTQPRAPPLA